MQNRVPLAISIAALVVAVLGTTPLGHAAYKAVVPVNSVGTPQLRNLSVTAPKIRGDAVDSGKVKNRSLKAIDFALGQIPAGPKGDKGDRGDKGEKGAPGATTVVLRKGTFQTTGAGTTSISANCLDGEVAVGGGGGPADGSPSTAVTIRASLPIPVTALKSPTGWLATMSHTTAGLTLAVFVICAKP